jgi:hypothetical protein
MGKGRGERSKFSCTVVRNKSWIGVGKGRGGVPARGPELLDANDENMAEMLLTELAGPVLRGSLGPGRREAASVIAVPGYSMVSTLCT